MTHISGIGHEHVLGEREQIEHCYFVPLVEVQELMRADPFPIELLRHVLAIDDVLQFQTLSLNPWPLIRRG